jgi:hypothetical protein
VIAIDADEMDVVRRRLGDAAADVTGAVPASPGSDAFGPAVLGAAVASFQAAVSRDAEGLRDRWRQLDEGVRGVFDDLSEVEAGAIADVGQIQERLL